MNVCQFRCQEVALEFKNRADVKIDRPSVGAVIRILEYELER